MDRRRLIRGMPRRTTAGVATLVAAALGFSLLVPGQQDGEAPADTRPARAAAPLDENGAQQQAIHTGKRAEATALRSATSTTYALPDGSFELTTHAAPVRAKVGNEWKPIDTTLARTKAGWAPKAAADPVVFSDGSGRTGGAADRASYSVSRAARMPIARAATTVAAEDGEFSDLVTFTSAGHAITVGWPGPLPTPVIDGSTALYQEVFDGVDLMLTARDSGFTHVLVVHSAEAAVAAGLSQMPYRFSSPDLTFHLDAVTHVVTAKNDKGEEIAVAPTPYMWDSAGKPATTEGADPLPAEPTDAPTPVYSEEPGDAPAGNPEDEDTEGGAGPDPLPSESSQSTSPSPSSPSAPSETPSGDESTAQSTALSSVGQSRNTHRTSYAAATSSPGAQDVLALPGLAGPQPGTHSSVGEATLTGQGTTSALLTVTPNKPLLTSEKTVWPVFIDPSVVGHSKNWTTAYERHPSSSFYDGANYNTGTTEARVGWESSTGGLSRSFFHLGWSTNIKGAHVTSAYIQLLETYAWSCENREMQIWHTGAISSSTTWNKQPDWKTELGRKSFAHGWNSTCPDSYVKYENAGVKALAEDAADGGWYNLTIGLRASTENSAASWKKFKAEGGSAPKMVITYNRKPKEPTGLSMTPDPDCDTTSPYRSVGSSDLTFAAQATDADGDLKYIDFEVWESGKTVAKDPVYDGNRTVDSAGRASVTIDGADGTASKFTNGKTYFWRPRAIDSTGAASTYAPPGTRDCGFVYDSTAPNSPEVSSATFPEDDGNGNEWSTAKFGSTGSFTFSPNGSTDTVKYSYSYNTTSYDKSVTVAAGASATVSLKPTFAGPNILFVKAADAANNTSSSPTKYLHYVRPRDTGDAPGDITGDSFPDLIAVDGTGNLRSYSGDSRGDVNIHAPGAHDNGEHLPDGYWADNGAPALISHSSDWYPGDGLTDLLARMPDGRLYAYPGDGYGGFNIDERLNVELPQNAPDPATLTEINSTRDITGDGLPDMFALAGDELWAFTGYTGATFTEARRLAVGSWDQRNIVGVDDITGDGIADLLWRGDIAGRGLSLRQGKSAVGGGVDLNSLALGANSATGQDETYGTGGWTRAEMPMLRGTPDATGDGIPDIWAVEDDGKLYFYPGGRSLHRTRYLVGEAGWTTLSTLG